MYRGNFGGRQAFNLVITACGWADSKGKFHLDLKSLEKNLEMVKNITGGGLKCVVDVHCMANKVWLYPSKKGEKSFAYKTLCQIMKLKNADAIAGWYICDEPFAKNKKGKPLKLDIKWIYDLAKEIRKTHKDMKKKYKIFADYGDITALKAKNRGYTKNKKMREGFYWNGKWVQSVKVDGKTIHRSYGIFGEDVVMINWYQDARGLARWFDFICSDVKPSKIHLVLVYDWSKNTPYNNNAMLVRTSEIIKFALKKGISGFWCWPWRDIYVSSHNRTYKGVGNWWEDNPKDKKFPKRYANLIESIP
jgi:hypothetical protein